MDPTSTIVRRDLSMTYQEFSTAQQQSMYIGLRVLPPLAVSQEAAQFQRLNVADITSNIEDTRRGPEGTYQRRKGRWSEDSYALQEHGVEERVDYAQVEKWGDLVRQETIARARGVNRILQRLEYDIAEQVMSTATWTGGALTTAVPTGWGVKATADPVADIDGASDKVRASSGVRGNKAVMSYKAYRNMLRTDRIEGLIKYDGIQILINAMAGFVPDMSAVSQVTSSLLDLLQLQEILVGDAAFNSADQGQQTPVFSDFWNVDRVMVCRVEDDGFEGDLQAPRPHIGRTLFSTKNSEPVPGQMMGGEDSLIFEEYEAPEARGKYLRPRNKRQVKIVHKQAGHLLTNVDA